MGMVVFFLAVLAVLIVIGGLYFYVKIWKVPDNSSQAKAIIQKVKQRQKQAALMPDEENAWTYYLRAAEKLDLSKLKKNNSATGNFKLSQLAYEISINGLKKEQIPLINDLISMNRETLSEVDQGFKQKRFFYYDPPKKSADDQWKLEMLWYYLVLSGDQARRKNNNLTAAKRYLQSVKLEEGLFCHRQVRIAYLFPLYNYLGLIEIMEKADQKTREYVLSQLHNIQFQDFEDGLESSLFYIDRYLAASLQKGGKAPPVVKSIVIGRERKVAQNMVLQLLKEYKNNPRQFEDAVENTKPARLTFAAHFLKQVIKRTYKRFITTRSILSGLKLIDALKKYKDKNGSYPEKLNQLVPGYIAEIPQDPLSDNGKYVYRSNGEKILFYSVGPDGIDEKGKRNIIDSHSGGDIIFLNTTDNQQDKLSTGEIDREEEIHGD